VAVRLVFGFVGHAVCRRFLSLVRFRDASGRLLLLGWLLRFSRCSGNLFPMKDGADLLGFI
jgi:hypothetical protein